MSILPILNELKTTTGIGSAKRKIQILKSNKENQDLKDFFFYALDPSINFGQSKIKKDSQSTEKIEQIELSEALRLIKDTLVSRKKTGNSAIRFLSKIYNSLNDDDKNILERVIARKPDVGMNAASINKVWPNLIYKSGYMRCLGYSNKAVKNWNWSDVYSQLKCDGLFLNIILDEQDFETRSGEKIDLKNKDIDTCKKFLYNELNRYVENPVLHGEIVCWKHGDPIERSRSNGIINSIKQGSRIPDDVKIVIEVWDVIPYNNFINKTPYKMPYSVRLSTLRDAINSLQMSEIQDTIENGFFDLVETKRVHSVAEAKRHFVDCLADGLEGTVLKNGQGVWKSHTSPNQLKMKNEFSFELKITGFKDGNGKFASTFGSIEAKSEDSLLTTFISGINDKERKHINDNRDFFIGKIVEVKAKGIFKNDDGTYSLMHPNFVEIRDDKSEADTLERIIQQEKDSLNAY